MLPAIAVAITSFRSARRIEESTGRFHRRKVCRLGPRPSCGRPLRSGSPISGISL